MIPFGIAEHVLHLFVLSVGLVDLVTGRNRFFGYVGVEHVPKLSARERATFTWADVLELDDFVRDAVDLDFETFAEFVRWVHG